MSPDSNQASDSTIQRRQSREELHTARIEPRRVSNVPTDLFYVTDSQIIIVIKYTQG